MIINKFNVISAWENVDKFIQEVKDDNVDSLWDKYLIKPFWDKVVEWASDGFEVRKPAPVRDLECLRNQLKIMNKSNITSLLENELVRIC